MIVLRILLVSLVASTYAYAQSSHDDLYVLMHVPWALVSIGADDVILPDEDRPTLAFGPEQATVEGSTGCNRYRAETTLALERVEPPEILAPRRVCAAEAAATERRFLAALEGVERAEFQGDPFDTLVLHGSGERLVFAAPGRGRAPPAPLLGVWWLREIDAPGWRSASPDDVFATLDLGTRVTRGDGGCNAFGAVSVVDAPRIWILPTIITSAYCGSRLDRFETSYTGALAFVERFEVRGGGDESGDDFLVLVGDEVRLTFTRMLDVDGLLTPVTSYRELDADALTERVHRALGPAPVDLRAAALVAAEPPPAEWLRILALPFPPPEAGPWSVAVLAEHLRDDAVRSVVTQVRFVRSDDGGWIVEFAARAFQCRRGPTSERFTAGSCP